jgi:hypothetical protein
LFPNVCYTLSDLLLKWSKKDGFFDRKMSWKYSYPYKNTILNV